MVFPRRLVHALRELHKDDEILRAQIERPVRPAKIKDPLRLEFALGVFTHVTQSFAGRAVCPYTLDRAIAHAPPPCLAQLKCLLRRRGAALPVARSNSSKHSAWLSPIANRTLICLVTAPARLSGCSVTNTMPCTASG